MLKPAESTTARFVLRGAQVDVDTHGAQVSLIDFTASRLRTLTGDVAFCDLRADPELFEGPKGVPQFESYRQMRKLTRDDWASSCLATNTVWLGYLAETLAAEKGGNWMTAAQRKALRAFRRRVAKCESAGGAVWDELFEGLWQVSQPAAAAAPLG